MINKKHLLIIGIYVIIGICVTILAVAMASNAEINKLIKEEQYYEAYKIISDKEKISKYYDNPSVMFFDVMAHHYEKDIIGDGSWVLPDFTGWSCAEVAYALKNMGQAYEIEFVQDDTANRNAIIEQMPRAGQEVTKEDVITLEVNSFFATDNVYSMLVFDLNPVTEIGEWIYFAIDNCIYRSRIDGKERTKIYENNNKARKIISVIGTPDKLFYIQTEKEIPHDSWINVISFADNSSKTICEMDVCINNYIYGSSLIIRSDDIYSIDIESEELTTLSKSYGDSIVYDGYLYYIDVEESDEINHKLIREKIMGNSTPVELLSVNGKIHYFYIHEGIIYYVSEQEYKDQQSFYLNQYNISNGEIKELLDLNGIPSFSYYEYNLNIWRDHLLLTHIFGNSFVYNISTGKRTDYVTAGLDGDENYSELFTVCGNYAWYREITTGDVTSPNFSTCRYNLMTLERDDFFME